MKQGPEAKCFRAFFTGYFFGVFLKEMNRKKANSCFYDFYWFDTFTCHQIIPADLKKMGSFR